jgi:hypothetical protein
MDPKEFLSGMNVLREAAKAGGDAASKGFGEGFKRSFTELQAGIGIVTAAIKTLGAVADTVIAGMSGDIDKLAEAVKKIPVIGEAFALGNRIGTGLAGTDFSAANADFERRRIGAQNQVRLALREEQERERQQAEADRATAERERVERKAAEDAAKAQEDRRQDFIREQAEAAETGRGFLRGLGTREVSLDRLVIDPATIAARSEEAQQTDVLREIARILRDGGFGVAQ